MSSEPQHELQNYVHRFVKNLLTPLSFYYLNIASGCRLVPRLTYSCAAGCETGAWRVNWLLGVTGRTRSLLALHPGR